MYVLFILSPPYLRNLKTIFQKYGHSPDITEFFRDWNQSVNFDDPNWFDQFEGPLMKFKNEFYTPRVRSSARRNDDEQHSFERNDGPHLMTPSLSPLPVEFFRVSFLSHLIFTLL